MLGKMEQMLVWEQAADMRIPKTTSSERGLELCLIEELDFFLFKCFVDVRVDSNSSKDIWDLGYCLNKR